MDAAQVSKAVTTSNRSSLNMRTLNMIGLYKDGLTLKEIGELQTPKISRERVRQLIRPFVSADEGGYKQNIKRISDEKSKVRDEYYLKRWGLTYSEFKKIPNETRQKFIMFIHNKKQHYHWMKIELNFAQWVKLWEESGKSSLRGVGRNNYGMMVVDKTKPLCTSNVIILKQKEISSFIRNKTLNKEN